MNKDRLISILSDQREQLYYNDLAALCPRRDEARLSADSRLAQVVIGVRRSGKSTLCEKFIRQNGLACAYVNFDDDRLQGLTTTDMDDVLDALYQLYGSFTHLFLDEIQNIEGWQLFVNRMLRQGVHLFVTGSNSKLLSTELTTHLTGRHSRIELYPFSFREYAYARDVDLHSRSTRAVALRKRALRAYLVDGGLPELMREPNRRGYIEALLHSVIYNDIARRFRVRHVDVLRRQAAYMIDNFCHEFVATELANIFGVSDHTAENYYSYLKEAFLLIGVPRFSYKSKERLRYEKAYVVDPAFVSDREGTFAPANVGWRLENAVCIELKRRVHPRYADLFYYKERGWEVDFLVAKDGRVTDLVQVAFDVSADKTLAREVNGLIHAAEKFGCENLLLITFEGGSDVVKSGHTIRVVSAAEWLITDYE